MNPDYKTEEAVTAGAAEELGQSPTGGQATAEYYGGSGWSTESLLGSRSDDKSRLRRPYTASGIIDLAPPSTPLHDRRRGLSRRAHSAAQAAKVYFANSSFEIAAGQPRHAQRNRCHCQKLRRCRSRSRRTHRQYWCARFQQDPFPASMKRWLSTSSSGKASIQPS